MISQVCYGLWLSRGVPYCHVVSGVHHYSSILYYSVVSTPCNPLRELVCWRKLESWACKVLKPCHFGCRITNHLHGLEDILFWVGEISFMLLHYSIKRCCTISVFTFKTLSERAKGFWHVPRPKSAHVRRRDLVSQVQILGLAPEACMERPIRSPEWRLLN